MVLVELRLVTKLTIPTSDWDLIQFVQSDCGVVIDKYEAVSCSDIGILSGRHVVVPPLFDGVMFGMRGHLFSC